MLKVRMKKLISHLLVMALVISSFAVGPVNQISWAEETQGGLIISEYTEQGYNNAIEIYNSSKEYLNLEDYRIGKVTNGKEDNISYTKDLQGVVSPSAIVVVLYNRANNDKLISKANRADLLIKSSEQAMNFNGNDPIFIEKIEKDSSGKIVNQETIDYIGVLDEYFGEDNTCIRNADIVTGQTEKHKFDNGQWDVKSKNYYENIGIHTFDGIQPANKLSKVYYTGGEVIVDPGSTITLNHKESDVKIFYSTSSDNKDDFVELTDKIVINEDTVVRAFARKDGMIDSDVVDFAFEVLVKKDIIDVRNRDNVPAIIEGIVTAKLGSYDYYMQDDTAGIIVSSYKLKSLDLKTGTKYRIKGQIEQYYDMAQIHPESLEAVEIVGKPGIPEPKVVSCNEVNETHEGQLIKVRNVHVESVDGKKNFTLKDSSGTAIVNTVGDDLDVGQDYEFIVGLIKYNYGKYTIFTRDDSEDVLWSTTKTYPVEASQGDKTGKVKIEVGTKIKLSSETEGASIYYLPGKDGTIDNPTPETGILYNDSNPITIDENTLAIKAIAVKDGLGNSPVRKYEYELGEFTYIHDIQGEGHESPLKDQKVSNVKGIVTAVSYKDRNQKGIYIQHLITK